VTFDARAPDKPTPTYISQNTVFFGRFNAVACPSLSQCTTVDNVGPWLTFNPNAPTTPAPVDTGVSLQALACPSSAECVAVDLSGGEVTFDPNNAGSATRVAIDSGGFIPTTTPTTSRGSGGIAEAAGLARVDRGVAAITLTCRGSGTCMGTIKLLARVAGKRAVYHQGTRRLVERTRTAVVGAATFAITTGARLVLRVYLSRQATSLVLKAGRRGLKVKVSGSDVKTRSLVLSESIPNARHGRRAKRR
jgi:hypothetical protein